MKSIDNENPYPENPEIESIFDLPLKSRYRCLLFYGDASGVNLTHGFNFNDIRGRVVVLKSFAIYPYSKGSVIDFYVEDSGATEQWTETIGGSVRLNRIFDRYEASANIKFLINGVPSGIFTSSGVLVDPTAGYPIDLSLDNIFYKFPKIQTWDIQITAEVVDDLQAGTFVAPLVKVVCECYLL